MYGQPAFGRDPVHPGVAHNLSMGSHCPSMHYAEPQIKRLLHSPARYALCMSSPNERLRQARARKFPSAAAAAEAMGITYGTYAGHENGHRGFPAKRAPQYARKFGVTEEWLLYGKGSIDDAPDERIDVPSADRLAEMIAEAMDELPVEATRGDFVRVVSSSLRVQLEQLQAAGEPQAEPVSLAKARKDRGTSARPQTPTKRSAQAG